MKNKTPHILHVFDGFRCGGTELRTCRIINGLKGKYKHTICSINGNFDAYGHLDPFLNIQKIHPASVNRPYPFNFFYIYQEIANIKPDLIVGYAWGAIDWLLVNSLFQFCPSIHAAEGFDDSEVIYRKYHRELIRRLIFKKCTLVLTCSRVLERMSVRSWKIPNKKVKHIPNGIDLKRFSSASNFKKNGDDRIDIGIVASLIKLKKHARLIRSFAKLKKIKNIHLHIAGDGPELPALNKLCEQLGISEYVQFLGHIDNPDILLKKIDIFCLSSDIEQMPMAVLEAMACSLPIVSTDVGDIKDMVSFDNKTFIVNRKSDDDYVRALEILVNNEKLRVKIGHKNKIKCYQIFNEQRMIGDYDQIYKAVIRGNI